MIKRASCPKILAVLLIIVPGLFISFGCSSANTPTTASAKTTTTSTISIAAKTTSMPSLTANSAITKSGSGVTVTNSSVLLGSWAEIKVDNYIGGLTQTRTYGASGPDAYVFLFDQINVNETHGGSTIYTGEWTFKNGSLTMKDNGFGAKPIIYTYLRLKDGILTALYIDKDLTQILTWQKLN
jgi:hypothetical protein